MLKGTSLFKRILGENKRGQEQVTQLTEPGSWAQSWPRGTPVAMVHFQGLPPSGPTCPPLGQISSGVHIFSGMSLPFQTTCWDPKGCFSQQLTQLLLTWPSSLSSRCTGCPPSGLMPSSSATFFLGHNRKPLQASSRVPRAPLPATSCLRPGTIPG